MTGKYCETCNDGPGYPCIGYLFDTYIPCHKCDKGKSISNDNDIRELKRVKSIAKTLRKRIKEYANNTK